jgi:hypothetical protein
LRAAARSLTSPDMVRLGITSRSRHRRCFAAATTASAVRGRKTGPQAVLAGGRSMASPARVGTGRGCPQPCVDTATAAGAEHGYLRGRVIRRTAGTAHDLDGGAGSRDATEHPFSAASTVADAAHHAVPNGGSRSRSKPRAVIASEVILALDGPTVGGQAVAGRGGVTGKAALRLPGQPVAAAVVRPRSARAAFPAGAVSPPARMSVRARW